MRTTLVLVLVTVVSTAYCWNIPNLPSGKRSQYYVLHADGGYKYGYDTGRSYFAKQTGDAQNEVAGHYVYKDGSGKDVDVKYTAGVQGFIPEGLENLLPKSEGPYAPLQSYSYPAPSAYSSVDSSSSDDQANTGDASYSFSFDTDTYKRQESSDPSGNVQGKYSYSNADGQHDLSYIAGSNTGFVATSGSLSVPNGLEGKAAPDAYPSARTYPGAERSFVPASVESAVNSDGSYSFEYSTNDHSRQESSDASGNVQGRYSFTNKAGTHDLSYVAGAQTGFQPTGGSLANPNGLDGQAGPYSAPAGAPISAPSPYSASVPASYTPSVSNPDGSYSFEYNAGDHSRQESSDASGNVQGRYAYTNAAGTHDLSYVAGSATGFLPTGGSLAAPNGLEGKSVPSTANEYTLSVYSGDSSSSADNQANTGDASYSFNIDTDEYKRQEVSDAQGNVKGSFSYKNAEGNHDLSFVAGSATGYQPTGGSLANPNGLEGSNVPSPSVYSAVPASGSYNPPASSYSSNDQDDQANTGDASYSFSVDTADYQREESSDAQGNVKGSYSYQNKDGSHDLSFVAGSATGFLPTGGSLANPNGVEGSNSPSPSVYSAAPVPESYSGDSQDEQANTGDASYSFSVDTADYQRQESSDAQGNVKGSYSFRNKEGSHDLSYVAGSSTGFVATGGSLSVPNGVLGSQPDVPVASVKYLPPQARAFGSPVHSTSNVGNFVVKTYLPPESPAKYGYSFESV